MEVGEVGRGSHHHDDQHHHHHDHGQLHQVGRGNLQPALLLASLDKSILQIRYIQRRTKEMELVNLYLGNSLKETTPLRE